MAAGKQVHIGKLDICPTEQEREREERMNNLHAPPLMIASERFSTNFGIPRHDRTGDYRIVRNITLRTRSPLNVIYREANKGLYMVA